MKQGENSWEDIQLSAGQGCLNSMNHRTRFSTASVAAVLMAWLDSIRQFSLLLGCILVLADRGPFAILSIRCLGFLRRTVIIGDKPMPFILISNQTEIAPRYHVPAAIEQD